MDFFVTIFLGLRFWFVDGPKGLAQYFGSLNKAFLELFSLGLLVRTFFRPWKNEYRKGLVGFSIGMGIFIKSIVIVVDLIVFIILLAAELLLLIGFVTWPFLTISILFI